MGKVVEHFRNYCLFCSELIIQHMVLFFKFLFKTSLTFHIAILHIALFLLFSFHFCILGKESENNFVRVRMLHKQQCVHLDGSIIMSEYTSAYFQEQIHHCQLCPRMCSIDRTAQTGFCQAPAGAVAARAALHFWEEPCISGTRGSGTVFFSGCTLRCCFCQNYKISREMYGKTLTTAELADVFLRLQEQGANNISLVTATHFLPWIIPALDLAKKQLHIPIVYNCGGYERIETILALKDYVDIWLPDFKYENSELSARYSQAPFYFQTAAKAIQQMIRQTGAPHVCSIPGESGPVMDRGVIIRHLVLPGQKDDSIRILHWIAQNLPKDSFYISLMSQYTPYEKNSMYPELNRRITSYEYQKVVDAALDLGLTMGFMQEKSSAKEEYTPAFDLEGL